MSKYSIVQSNVNTHAEKLAWKRSGFKDRKTLEDAVRDLPLEKKVEMLIEANMKELATMLFKEKQEFLLNLGHKTWVDGSELYEYAKKTYNDDKWNIDEYNFHPICIIDGVRVIQMNTHTMEKLKKQRQGNKNE